MGVAAARALEECIELLVIPGAAYWHSRSQGPEVLPDVVVASGGRTR
jgi:hypothetical protein